MYSICQPPFSLQFDTMTKAELEAYGRWFHAVMPARIAELSNAVTSTPGFADWEPNETPQSLLPLGRWFAGQVETRQRTSSESEEIAERGAFAIDVPSDELTSRTFSLALDIGMYFGRVVVKNLRGTSWQQALKNKRMEDYGQPVIAGFGRTTMNPVQLLVTMAYGVSQGRTTGERLAELYTVWAKMVETG